MSHPNCTGDVDTCGTCSTRRDRLEAERDGDYSWGYTERELADAADAAAADAFFGRWE